MSEFDKNIYKGVDPMTDDKKVQFDSIFNNEDYASDSNIFDTTWSEKTTEQTNSQQSQEPPRMPDPEPAKRRPAKKDKPSFTTKAIVACLAVAIGATTLGVGIGVGGSIGNRFLPKTNSAVAEPSATAEPSAESSAGIFAEQQPTIEYDASELSVGMSNVSTIVKKISDAVVSINISVSVQSFFNQVSEQQGAGSGIIFSVDNDKVYIATNNHVIQEANKVSISLDDKTQFSASFVGSDSQSDLAVISVSKSELDAAGVSYKVADFGNSSLLEVGDEVVAIGNAMGEGKTATSGIISAINKQINVDGKTLDVIQTDAAINPGNSGGALANAKGEVIGINTAKLQSSNVEGMGYSIPSNAAKEILENLKTNGSVNKPYLGIQGMTITEQTKEMYNLPSLGVYVAEVTPGGSAAAAGLLPSDIIIGFNETQIQTMDDLSAAIAGAQVGDTVQIFIYRNGHVPMTIEATLGNLNPNSNF